jgi:riboflavin synthase
VFTGIIEELGEVVGLERLADSARLTVRGRRVIADTRPGDSIAVDGCCLTVVDLEPDEGRCTVDVMAETLERTTVGTLRVGQRVNLERAVRADGRLGGHLVQGHVDGTGRITRREHTPRWDVLEVAIPARLRRYVAEKGSIAVDGVSLTVVEVRDHPEPSFTVGLIPTTLALTTLGHKRVGDAVNLEVDVLAKYVERLLVTSRGTSRTTLVAAVAEGADA